MLTPVMLRSRSQQGFSRVSLQLHKWSAAGTRIEAPKAPRGVWGWGGGVPPNRGRGLGRGCAPSQKKKNFWLSIWSVLMHSGWYFLQFSYLFYTQNRCNLVLLPILFFKFFASKRTWFIFLHFGVGKSSMPPVQYWSGLQNALHCT